MRVEDLARVCRVAAAVKRVLAGGVATRIDSWCRSTRVEEGGEISSNLVLCGDRGELRQRLANAQTFVVSEKERLILDDRSAQRKAELVLLVGLLTKGVEGVGGVNLFVPQKLEHVAVDLVGPRFDDGVHNGAVAAAEFGIVRIGLNLKLGDGVHGRLHHIGCAIEDVAQVRVVVDAVEQEVILQRASAVGAEAEAGFDARTGLGGSDAGAEKSELRVVASVQGKRVDAPAVHHLAKFGGFGFELWTLAGDCHDFRCHARLELQVHANAVLDVHLNRAGNGLLESLLLDGDAVTADPERAGDILSLIIGGESQLDAVIHVGYRDLGARDHRTARVAHQAYNGSGIFLRPQRRGQREEHRRKEHRRAQGRESLRTKEMEGHGRLLNRLTRMSVTGRLGPAKIGYWELRTFGVILRTITFT